MRNFKSLLFIPIVIVILWRCQEKTIDKEKDIAAIKDLFSDYVHYGQTGNLDGMMSIWQDEPSKYY